MNKLSRPAVCEHCGVLLGTPHDGGCPFGATEDLERLARVAFEAYASHMATAKTLRMKTPIAEWAQQHLEVRASWLASTRAVIREQARETPERCPGATSIGPHRFAPDPSHGGRCRVCGYADEE